MFEQGGDLNPRDMYEFADANVLQKELFFWKAEKIINASWDKAFLNRCLSLMTKARHEDWMLGYAIAQAASKRILRLEFYNPLTWGRYFAVTRFFRKTVLPLFQRRHADSGGDDRLHRTGC